MSHLKERKEKNCLNCNAEVIGKYCHICGQENIEPKESAWHLVQHFFEDITHFDGKFFSTIGLLITKPGYLPAEYIRGRRVSYLNPIRMYIFTSAFFFLLFFAFFKPEKTNITENSTINGKTWQQIEAMDSATYTAFARNINKEEQRGDTPMTRQQLRIFFDSVINKSLGSTGTGIQLTPNHYRSKAEYDSLLRSGKKKHSWLERQLTYKQMELDERYKGNGSEAAKTITEAFLHKLPQLLFISLPLFALLLQMLYLRRKEFYYVSHGIFSIHLYIFLFIALLAGLCVNKLQLATHWAFLSIVKGIIGLAVYIYIYKALRYFYRQGRGKTILKFVLLLISFFILISLLFLIFFLFSLFSI